MGYGPTPPEDFICRFRHNCPHLQGLSADWMWTFYQQNPLLADQYEYQLRELNSEINELSQRVRELELENERIRAQLHALQRSQFKGRKPPASAGCDGPTPKKKKRGAPVGHPPWRRRKPTRIDAEVTVCAPDRCPHCHGSDLQAVDQIKEHLQEDIVLEPRTRTTRYLHHQAYCPQCQRNVMESGPGEMLNSYIGPAAKATAVYMRYELNVSDRKISRFFEDFFGLKFVPASAYGFERQAVRRGRPLYEDLRQKIQSLAVVHADETSWRNDGKPHWVWYAGNVDLAYFHIDAHRSSEAAQAVLGEQFDGVLVADAYASYNAVNPEGRQSCLAHIKTRAKELGKELALLEGEAADPAAQKFCKQIEQWVHGVCQEHRKLARGPWRAKRARAKARAFEEQLIQYCAKPLKHPRTETFRLRLGGKEQNDLLTCMTSPDVPPTNNQAEQSLRPVVIMRRVIQGTRSEKGMENHSVIRSLVETARRQGKKCQDFLFDLFTKSTSQAQASLYRKAKAEKPRPNMRC